MKAQLYRRWPWGAFTCLVGFTLTGIAARDVEPVYRGSARLRIEDKTLPTTVEASAIELHVHEYLEELTERMVAVETLAPPTKRDSPLFGVDSAQIETRLKDFTAKEDSAGGLPTVSIDFEINFQADEPGRAMEVTEAIVNLYLRNDRRAQLSPNSLANELSQATLETDRSAAELHRLETEVDAFKWENAAALPELYDVNIQAMERTDRERRQLDAEVEALEQRRIELDRGLREMRQGHEALRASTTPDDLNSEQLTALQTELAILRGLYGSDSSAAVALSREIGALQTEVDRRLQIARDELNNANEQLARAERQYPIDHPDVVRLAHLVSALESQARRLTVTGLTNAERRYIEGIARERRGIDGRIDELRTQQQNLRAKVADYEARAMQAPVLEQQYDALQEKLANARARHEDALERRKQVAHQHQLAQQQRAGELIVLAPASVTRSMLNWPMAVIALGVVSTVSGAWLIIHLLETADRRVSGASTVRRLQGSLPLAEIPVIPMSGGRDA